LRIADESVFLLAGETIMTFWLPEVSSNGNQSSKWQKWEPENEKCNITFHLLPTSSPVKISDGIPSSDFVENLQCLLL